jgi:phage terminase small subunit
MLPALKPTTGELSTMQAAFVEAFVTNGGDKEDAAIQAGYSPNTARTQAYALLRNPKIMQAVLERTGIEIIANAPRARATLTRLLNAKSDYVALEAAKDLLDRAGFKPSEKVDHRLSGEISVNIDLS